jgi:hypothetical protein
MNQSSNLKGQDNLGKPTFGHGVPVSTVPTPHSALGSPKSDDGGFRTRKRLALVTDIILEAIQQQFHRPGQPINLFQPISN